MATIEYPDHLRYLDSHEYASIEGDVATIGLSAYAIDELGDIVFLELPDIGDSIEQGETFGSIESVKAVEDIYAPVTGEVLECNTDAVEAPEILSDDAYERGWLLKVKVAEGASLDHMLSAEAYKSRVAGE